jgi:cysteine-rich secretory family protein
MNRLGCIVLVGLIAFMAAVQEQVSAAGSKPSKAEQRIFYLLNQERQLAGLKKLEWNEQAAQAARTHAALLAEHGELAHQFPGELPLRDRLVSTAVRFTSAAENVARADSEDEAHLALMYSPGHRENILNKNYSAAGVGVVERAGRLYVTQDFIRIVPVYGEEEFRSAFVKAFNSARQAKGMKAILAQKDFALHEAACSTRGDAVALPLKVGFAGELVVFSLSEPDELPAEILKRAQIASLSRMNIGVCFRPDSEHGNGNFWVVAAFAM